MTPTEATWRRVNRERPCPICGHTDWCSTSADGAVAICMRAESARPTKNGGFLHRLTDAPRPQTPRAVVLRIRSAAPDFTPLATSYQEAASADQLDELAAQLGVSVANLNAFRVGWSCSHDAHTFPMADPASGRVCGIRLRAVDGAKCSVSGGREGLFLPLDLDVTGKTLLVCEGASDAVAAHSVGFTATVGRPSCSGGTSHIVALVRAQRPACVALVADRDEPGVRGAEALASILVLHHRDVRTITPPAGVKDLRAWVQSGATREDVERTIHVADVRRANLTTTSRKG